MTIIYILSSCQPSTKKRLPEENTSSNETTAWLPKEYQPANPEVIALTDSAALLQVSAQQDPNLSPAGRQAAIQQAKSLLQQVIKLDPKYGLAYSNMAAIHLEQADTSAAINALKKRLDLEPNLLQGWLFLGTIYDYQGDSSKAMQHYQRALEIVNNRLDKGKNYANQADIVYYYDNWASRAQTLIMMGKEEAAYAEVWQLIEEARPILGDQVSTYAAMLSRKRRDFIGHNK